MGQEGHASQKIGTIDAVFNELSRHDRFLEAVGPGPFGQTGEHRLQLDVGKRFVGSHRCSASNA